jgi:hypothetical protein
LLQRKIWLNFRAFSETFLRFGEHAKNHFCYNPISETCDGNIKSTVNNSCKWQSNIYFKVVATSAAFVFL